MAEQIHINNYEQLWEEIKKLEKSKTTFFLYFTGSKDKDGVSWCSDCNAAKPVLEKYIGKLSSDLKILFVDVGNRDEYVYIKDTYTGFKNPECKFRKDSKLNISRVPTLFKWGDSQAQLVESELTQDDLLELFFEEFL